MPAIEIEVHRWRGFHRHKGAIELGFISVVWRLRGILTQLHAAWSKLSETLGEG